MSSHFRQRWILWYYTRLLEASWEPQTMKYMRRVRGGLFVDVGANVGLYCSKLKKNFRRMIAIEADPAIYELLKRTCPANCEPINSVASNIEGYVSFYSAQRLGTNAMQGTIFPPGEQEWILGKKADVELRLPAAPLSKILANETFIDLIKVDVEGAEWKVLEGAESIMPKIKRWVIELHQPNRKMELDARMEQYGYRRSEWLDSHRATIVGAFERSDQK
jgi:FkbM family methyltransferase